MPGSFAKTALFLHGLLSGSLIFSQLRTMLEQNLRVAILDMNNLVANRGVGYIQKMMAQYPQFGTIDTFEVRTAQELPDLSYDLYISSGGPGSPWELEGWSVDYFKLIDQLRAHNAKDNHKKYVFFICHSFQVACIYFHVGQVVPRMHESFGIWPCYLTDAALFDPLFRLLPQEFYIADFRKYQVVSPNQDVLAAMGAEVLAIEQLTKEPERAVMAIRFSNEMVGTQFHPEADEVGMEDYLLNDERRLKIIEVFGETCYNNMLHQVYAPDRIGHTYRTLLPNFIRQVIQNHMHAAVAVP
jgi:GMP synthase-like glutamine amidotransferase